VGEVVLRTEIHYLLVHEISLVVGDDGMRKLKVAHDVLPEDLTICYHVTSGRGTTFTHLVK